jgi:DNA repair exonuclease SbcCD ATPase subunit
MNEQKYKVIFNMKIRKIQIKNYKMFNDVTLDFTDTNGETLETIVIAGLNGAGKTSLLQLLSTEP